MGAEVDQFRRIVLAERRRHRDADADDRLVPIRRELLRRHRRRAIEVHRQSQSRIALPEPADLRGFTEIQAFHVTGDHGHDHARVGRSSAPG